MISPKATTDKPKNAKKNLKKHYWLLVAVCLFAAFIGSEFTETMEAFKSLGTVNNEIQGAASVEANVDTVANSSVEVLWFRQWAQ